MSRYVLYKGDHLFRVCLGMCYGISPIKCVSRYVLREITGTEYGVGYIMIPEQCMSSRYVLRGITCNVYVLICVKGDHL